MKATLPLFFAALLLMSAAPGATVSIPAAADATLFGPPRDALADGAGDWFFAGVNSEGNVRRGLLRFDLAGAVPAGATITGVEVRLTVDRGRLFPAPATLHRMTASWNEGSANAPGSEGLGSAAQPGDVTWNYRELGGAAWATPGATWPSRPPLSQTSTAWAS